jgi:hypothetical protein
MTTYKYTDATNTVVHVIDEDGISRMSMLASALPADTVIDPADPTTEAPALDPVDKLKAFLAANPDVAAIING